MPTGEIRHISTREMYIPVFVFATKRAVVFSPKKCVCVCGIFQALFPHCTASIKTPKFSKLVIKWGRAILIYFSTMYFSLFSCFCLATTSTLPHQHYILCFMLVRYSVPLLLPLRVFFIKKILPFLKRMVFKIFFSHFVFFDKALAVLKHHPAHQPFKNPRAPYTIWTCLITSNSPTCEGWVIFG